MPKIWKTIKPKKYKNIKQCLKDLKKNNFKISAWIENVIKNKCFLYLFTPQILFGPHAKMSKSAHFCMRTNKHLGGEPIKKTL